MKSKATKARETEVSAQWFRDRLDYEAETGLLRWKDCDSVNKKHRGEVAGFLTTTTQGYSRFMVHGFMDKIYIAARVVWLICSGDWPSEEIDHIYGDSTVNLFSGLRDVTREVNHKNMPMNSRNKSGVVGVCWHKAAKKWSAEIIANGKKVYLGLFCDIKIAIGVRKKAEVEYGFHPNHGRSK